jgi:hypothetical protein
MEDFLDDPLGEAVAKAAQTWYAWVKGKLFTMSNAAVLIWVRSSGGQRPLWRLANLRQGEALQSDPRGRQGLASTLTESVPQNLRPRGVSLPLQELWPTSRKYEIYFQY